MTARTSSKRLYVAFVALLTAVFTLLAATIRLVVALVAWAASRVEAGTRKKAAPAPARPAAATPVRLTIVPPPAPSAAVERLTTALVGLGFKAPAVARFVASLGDRVEREPLADLIKAGLRYLAPAVAS